MVREIIKLLLAYKRNSRLWNSFVYVIYVFLRVTLRSELIRTFELSLILFNDHSKSLFLWIELNIYFSITNTEGGTGAKQFLENITIFTHLIRIHYSRLNFKVTPTKIYLGVIHKG